MSAPIALIPDQVFADIALPLLPSVARVARALAKDAADADDLVQETYLRALKHWHTFIPGSDCRRWLVTICRNVHYAQYNRARVVTAVEDDELESLAAARVHNAARAAGLSDVFSRMDLGPAIHAAIARLDPVFGSVVTLYDVEGYTYEEIAELLEIPMGTVRSRLYRARRLLQQDLVEYARDAGFGPAELTRPTLLPPADG